MALWREPNSFFHFYRISSRVNEFWLLQNFHLEVPVWFVMLCVCISNTNVSEKYLKQMILLSLGQSTLFRLRILRMRNVTSECPSSFFGNSAARLHQKGPKSLNQFWPHDQRNICVFSQREMNLLQRREWKKKCQKFICFPAKTQILSALWI